MNAHPTLADLRGRVFKHSGPEGGPEIGNWLARRVGRPAAVYGTWLAVRMGLSAHQVTLAALAAALGSSVWIGTGTRTGFVAGALLAWLAYWLDHVDGQVARWRGTAGLDGVYFDYLMHHASVMALGFGLGYGLAVRRGDPLWAVGGFLLAMGWAFLGLQNDCRYKAFFQRLKRDRRSYRLDGGAGGRPSPPARWPHRGWGMVTWPLFKASEPHVVLVGLSGLALVAVVSADAWEGLWLTSVRVLAVLAPVLAAARAARAVRRESVTEEFDRWFRCPSS
jgi:hypothetical protein